MDWRVKMGDFLEKDFESVWNNSKREGKQEVSGLITGKIM